MELARDYAALRHIPDSNVVDLDLPTMPSLEMSPTDFNRQIWGPAQRQAHERGLDDHILAWVYSVDFPIRITTTPAMSIQGITFLRGKLPEKDAVEKGTYASPLFNGPENPSVAGFPPQSLDVQHDWLGKDMPLPSMMLGFMGPRGNSKEEILTCLRSGIQADQSMPEGAICIVTNQDIRSLCRQWEFLPAGRELKTQGITVIITNAFPLAKTASPGTIGLNGLMAGAADIPGISSGGFHFLPGAIADHLTSFGAAFDNPGQTKVTDWIRAGATAAAGTVTEPYSIWTKFPHARIFAHPPAGCTILESFYGSIRCPLQILIIGEPLSAPWLPAATLNFSGLPPGAILDKRRPVTIGIRPASGDVFNRFMFLLDGRTFQKTGKSQEVMLDPAGLSKGHHKLRVVAYRVGSVRSQAFSEIEFEVK